MRKVTTWLGLVAATAAAGCTIGHYSKATWTFGEADQGFPAKWDGLQARVSADAIPNTDAFAHLEETGFRRVADEPLSTFSSDVDTAAYAIVRRMLVEGRRPPAGAVRIEEMVNYFPYSYDPPTGEDPVAVRAESAACPWDESHRLLRIGVKAREVQFLARRPNNLVFLLDVSGSMKPKDRLPLVVESMKLLVEQLREDDRVAIVVYAGAAGLVLPPTSGRDKETIVDALDDLSAGGGTNGGEGIRLAYETAKASFVQGGTNRVILCTDGDFNLGVSNQSDLVELVKKGAKDGVWLSVLGVGLGNFKDATMERLADLGNGNYAYLDTIAEGRKALVEQAGGTIVTVAKDVKLQVEFSPAQVSAYRLIGYENRALAAQDFNDDKKDAGDVGAGHAVTALYELVPAGVAAPAATVDPLKYQSGRGPSFESTSGELCTVKVRYKDPESSRSRLLETAVADSRASLPQASADFRFAAAVASFGMLLRRSEHAGSASYDAVASLAEGGLGADPGGYRREFLGLVGRAKALPAN
jgi:Ca-activated chloride channel family protein